MHITTHISVLMSGPRKAKSGNLARQILGATAVKHGMHTQLDFGSDMGGICPGYTFPIDVLCEKVPQKRTSSLRLDLRSYIHKHTLIYILVRKYVYMFVCMCV